MPTRWESAERPLFVKTVIVNGSRHAILSPVDPLRQVTTTTGRRQEPPNCTCADVNGEAIGRRTRSCYRATRDISSELQNCLVKLRVGLEQKRTMGRDSVRLEEEEEDDEDADYEEVVDKSKEEYRQLARREEFPAGNTKAEEETMVYSLPRINSAADTEDQTEKRRTFPIGDTTEELLRNCSEYFFPIVYIKANNLNWDVATADRCIAKNIHNPLSDRVLQWLELTRKRQERSETAAAPTVEVETTRKQAKKSSHKLKVAKNPEEEIRLDEDVETVLSSEVTDDSLWSSSLVSIPEKSGSELSVTEQLQQSILNSFEGIVSIDGKQRSTPGARRRGLPVKQTNLKISSDEEEHWDARRWRSEKQQKRTWDCRRRGRQREEAADTVKLEMGSTNGRRIWATEKGNSKPQLHIFMPEIDLEAEETGSDSDAD